MVDVAAGAVHGRSKGRIMAGTPWKHTVTRLPLQPLIDATGVENATMAAERWGCFHSQVWLAKREGLTVWMADRWACHSGIHPGEIWPNWFEIEIGVRNV